MRLLCLLLLTPVTAACSNTDETAPADRAEASASSAATLPAGAPAAPTGEVQAAAVAAPAEPVAPPSGDAAMAPLPLELGFYVPADIACSDASNATLSLLRRTGINTSRVPCDFTAVEPLGGNRFRVTERCSSGGPAWGTPEEVSTSTATYAIAAPTRFRIESEGGHAVTMQHCPQGELPDPWRSNDIADIIE